MTENQWTVFNHPGAFANMLDIVNADLKRPYGAEQLWIRICDLETINGRLSVDIESDRTKSGNETTVSVSRNADSDIDHPGIRNDNDDSLVFHNPHPFARGMDRVNALLERPYTAREMWDEVCKAKKVKGTARIVLAGSRTRTGAKTVVGFNYDGLVRIHSIQMGNTPAIDMPY